MIKPFAVLPLVFLLHDAAAGQAEMTYERVNLSVSAEQQVDNDTLVAVMSAQQEGNDPSRLAKEINQRIQQAVGRAKEIPDIRVQTLGYQTSPVYKDGRFTQLKAIGWVVEDYQCAQISINLTDYTVTSMHHALDASRELAAERGIVITGSEVVGVVPYAAMRESGRHYLGRMMKSTGIPARDVVTTAVQSLGLADVAEFDIDKKVVGLPVQDGPLVNLKVADFVDEVSRDTPAPGDGTAGGSIAALAGAIGSALASMVVNLSVGKGEYDDRYEELCEMADRAQDIKDRLLRAVDEDTEAFNEVIAGMRMPKDTAEQKETRATAIRAGYRERLEAWRRARRTCTRPWPGRSGKRSTGTPSRAGSSGFFEAAAHGGEHARSTCRRPMSPPTTTHLQRRFPWPVLNR